jgi:HTH-type transcriptional regulator/antitoxin HigA
LARELLEKQGIPVVIERHLEHTYLDGAAFLRADNVPVIGLTLRHDKLDNFWFTLLHELVHVGWHLNAERPTFFDDLDATGQDDIEKEADRRAADALIAPESWTHAGITATADIRDVESFAQSVRRHPAIVAGRIQHETENYRRFAKFLGRNQVRGLFPEHK